MPALTEDQKKVLEQLKEKYEAYLEQQYVDAAIAEGDLKGRLKAAKAVVIQQDYYPGFRTNPEIGLKRFYEKNEEKFEKPVIALRNNGTARGGHWDFRMAQTNDDGSYQNSTQESVSGAGFSCGAFTVIRILSKVCKKGAKIFAKGLLNRGFSKEDSDKLVKSLEEGKDLTEDSGHLARRFVAKLVELQMKKEGETDEEIKAKMEDVMTRQLEQEQITKALKYFGVESIFYHELFQNEPQNFQEWFNNAYFVQDAGALNATAQTNRAELHSSLGENKEDFTASYLDELKTSLERNEDIFNQETLEDEEAEKLNYEMFLAKMLYGVNELNLQAVEDILTGKEDALKQQIDQFLFPTTESLKEVYEGDGFNAEKCYELLRASDSYCAVYVPKINEYLKACGFNPDNNPHFDNAGDLYKDSPDRFKNLVESLCALTKNNSKLLTGFSKEQQNKLFKNICEFAKETNQTNFHKLKQAAQTVKFNLGNDNLPEPPVTEIEALVIKKGRTILPQYQNQNQIDEDFEPDLEKPQKTKPYIGLEVDEEGNLSLIEDKTKDKKTVLGKDEYYEQQTDGSVKYFSELEAAQSGEAKKSWREELMKYYKGSNKEIPTPVIQAITVVALNKQIQNQNSKI